MMIDTDVLIWHMRGNPRARDVLNREKDLTLSAVTNIELTQGLRNKNEFRELRRAFRAWNVRILHMTEEISSKAVFYVERHFLSHRLTLADALIGASAVVHGEMLFTANDRHYRMIKELRLKIFRP